MLSTHVNASRKGEVGVAPAAGGGYSMGPTFQIKPATSSQRSAGTVSCGAAEGAAEVAQALPPGAPASSLKRQLSLGEGEDDSQTSSQAFSKSQRSSLGCTPARRAAAQRARALWAGDGEGGEGLESGDEVADSGYSGLEFLLRACQMLEPLHPEEACRVTSVPQPGRRGGGASVEGTPKITRQARHAAAASADASPASLGLPPASCRPVSRRLLARVVDGDDGSDYDGGDTDYLPSRRPARSTRAQRASARAASVSAAPSAGGGAAAGSAAGAATASSVELPVAAVPRGGRWSGETKVLITGPCMWPECEHPYDSPQWRKGPPQHPVLCNACGTRWLRNGTLKPLVPRRGLRYKNKPKPVKGKAAAAAAAAMAAATAVAAMMPAAAAPPPIPAPVQHKQLPAVALAQPANSSDLSEGGRSECEDPTALFSHQALQSLPLPVPLHVGRLPFMPTALSFSPGMAFGPAAMFGMDPVAAAAAAAEALKKAPALFSSSAVPPPMLAPWGFFPTSQPPALFQPPAAVVGVKHAASQADAAMLNAEQSQAAAPERRQQQQQEPPLLSQAASAAVEVP